METRIEHTIDELVSHAARRKRPVKCTGLSGADRGYLLSRLARDMNGVMLLVAPFDQEARRLASDLEFCLSGLPDGERPDILFFPHYHILPFKDTPYHGETSCERINTLYRLIEGGRGAVVVTTAQALMSRLIPRGVLAGYADYLLEGEDLDRDAFLNRLVDGGYQSSLVVEEPGEFSVRGGILDVYSPNYEDPLRIEFFGDTVDSIRTFSPANQRTVNRLPEAVILPASEAVVDENALLGFVHGIREQGSRLGMKVTRIRGIAEELKESRRFSGHEAFLPLLYEHTDTLFDYLPAGALCVVADPRQVRAEMEGYGRKLAENHEKVREDGRLCLPAEVTHLTADEAMRGVELARPVTLEVLDIREPGKERDEEPGEIHFSIEDNAGLAQELANRADPEQPFSPLADWMADRFEDGCGVVIACPSRSRAEQLETMLAHYGIGAKRTTTWPREAAKGGGAFLALGQLSSGFVWRSERLAVVTDREIFGRARRRPAKARPRTELLDLAELKQGDFVVHVDHGIGRYDGLIKMDVNGVANDFLLLVYKEEDKLYLPVDRTNLIQKYQGVENIAPAVDKLGGKSWERVKSKVKRSVEKIAGQLLELYAKRNARQGHAFAPSDSYFRNFEDGFEYEETPDQLKAIHDALDDMESPRPMDRLVCGDVGYGKTEVALRAAFKAVSDSKQVALLAPTTILCEQHFETFKRRFHNYPIRVECLNRFRTPKEQAAIVADIKAGKVDIAIGTHRLLSRDVSFRDLGLVVIDEEQRFGVRHKERLKELRATVDVLALTATPIPRTLHLSMMGIRDISVITTPPEQRRPITTYISPFDDALVAEAIRREVNRGGQVFFVHNSVQTIWSMAERLEGLVPEARVGVAHGQLTEDKLERVMMRFVKREIDVLVCTTIIESGLDIPAANTILVNRADRFGLSQIYQLRGRVGRGDEQAYAYLFIPGETTLTRDAQRRLKVLMEHSDLGAGFQLAMSDLQIRGGGTILGSAQSGHIAAVGYEMFLQLMETAVANLKGEEVVEPLEPEINLDYSAFFPETYIPDTDQRLLAYRRLARLRDLDAISAFKEEMEDRFGKMPDEASQLLYKIMLKCRCRNAGVKRLDLAKTGLALTLSPEHVRRPEALLEMASENPQRFRLGQDGALRVSLTGESVRARTKQVKNVLKEMARRVNE
ncbi:MAG: transcription-repair coupling factor [Desulfatibacillaceae bacterium]